MEVKQITRNIRVNQDRRDIKVHRVDRNIAVNLVGRRGPQGPPGSDATDKNFLMNFTNTDEITVTHGLDKFPSVTVTDSAGDEVEGDVEHVSVDELIVRFSGSFSGKIICN